MSSVGDVPAEMRRRLGVLRPTLLELVDESAQHAGHAGALLVHTDAGGQARVVEARLG